VVNIVGAGVAVFPLEPIGLYLSGILTSVGMLPGGLLKEALITMWP